MQVLQFDQRNALSAIGQQYLDQQLNDWVDFPPTMEGIDLAMQRQKMPSSQRIALTDIWASQYEPSAPQQEQIRQLRRENVFTVTTGQQLGLATGPAYTIYKIASTIALARQHNQLHPESILIPVFWLASEDHDFEEINHFETRNGSFQWNAPHGGPVGRMQTNGIVESLQPWLEHLTKMGHDETAQMLIKSYHQTTLSEAFRKIIHTVFSQHELLVIDADDRNLKALFAPIMWQELTEGFVTQSMQVSSKWFEEKGFKTQVNPREINLFYQLDTMRKRIVRNDDTWTVLDTDFRWSQDELKQELTNHPERFSPNVAMRPLYQETILPNLAYIGGPGELSYWLQLKPVFHAASLRMPVLLLRDSAMVLSKQAMQKWRKWGSEMALLQSSFEAEQRRVVQAEMVDLELEKKAIETIMNDLKRKLEPIEQSLAVAADMEWKKQMQGLENLEKKMAKAIRLREEIKWQQLSKFFEEIKPNGEPQERHLNFFDLQCVSKVPLAPLLVDHFDPLAHKMTVFMDDDLNTIEVESQR